MRVPKKGVYMLTRKGQRTLIRVLLLYAQWKWEHPAKETEN